MFSSHLLSSPLQSEKRLVTGKDLHRRAAPAPRVRDRRATASLAIARASVMGLGNDDDDDNDDNARESGGSDLGPEAAVADDTPWARFSGGGEAKGGAAGAAAASPRRRAKRDPVPSEFWAPVAAAGEGGGPGSAIGGASAVGARSRAGDGARGNAAAFEGRDWSFLARIPVHAAPALKTPHLR